MMRSVSQKQTSKGIGSVNLGEVDLIMIKSFKFITGYSISNYHRYHFNFDNFMSEEKKPQ